MTFMSRRGWALFITVSVLWGVPYLFISLAMEGMGPVSVAAARVVLGAVALLPFAVRHGLPGLLRRHGSRLMAVALVEVVAPFSLIAIGEQTVSSGLAAVLVATEPLFILLLGLVWKGADRVSGLAWAGAGIGFLGVVTLFGVRGAGGGLPLIITAAACYAVGALLVRRWFADESSLAVTTAMLLLAAPVLIALAAVAEPLPHPTRGGLLALLVLGVGCTAGGFTTFFALIASSGPARAAFITYVAPLVAVTAGSLLRDEPLTARTLAGACLVLLGALLATRPPRSPGPARIAEAEG